MLRHALINTFVPAADENDVFFILELPHLFLRQFLPARREKNDVRLSRLAFHRLHGAVYRLNHHDHSGTATVGFVVNCVVRVVCKIARVYEPHVNCPLRARLADKGGVKI